MRQLCDLCFCHFGSFHHFCWHHHDVLVYLSAHPLIHIIRQVTQLGDVPVVAVAERPQMRSKSPRLDLLKNVSGSGVRKYYTYSTSGNASTSPRALRSMNIVRCMAGSHLLVLLGQSLDMCHSLTQKKKNVVICLANYTCIYIEMLFIYVSFVISIQRYGTAGDKSQCIHFHHHSEKHPGH